MTNPFKPSISVLCKLGSIAVHTEEVISEKGHVFDVLALQSLFKDAELRQWFKDMNALGMLPVRR